MNDGPELASYLRIEERELEAGGLNLYGVDTRPRTSDGRSKPNGRRVGRDIVRKFVLVVAAVLVAVVSAGVAHSASSQSAGSLVGTWARTTTCAELTNAFRSAGISKLVNETVVGNGFIPGVQNPDQLRDPARPCLGAVPRKHSHFFLKNGGFGSLDWNGEPVDDGRYRVTKPGTVTISKEFPNVTFRYQIRGKTISFTPLVPKGCQSFRCAWAISVAYPGKAWKRVG